MLSSRMSAAEDTSTVHNCLRDFSAQEVGESAAIAFVRVVLHQAEEAVHDHALAELDHPAGAAAVTAKLLPLLQWGTLLCDRSDDFLTAGHKSPPGDKVLPMGCYLPEVEPSPCEIDNWARGKVPSKPAGSEIQSNAPTSERMPESLQSMSTDDPGRHGGPETEGRTHRTGRALATTPDGAQGGDGTAWASGDGFVGELGLTTPVFDSEGAGGPGERAGRGRTKDERMFLEGLRHREEARAREIHDTKERLEREAREAQQRADRLTKELKGREWVWGVDGEILVLDPVSAEKIPGPVVPRVEIRNATKPRAIHDDASRNTNNTHNSETTLSGERGGDKGKRVSMKASGVGGEEGIADSKNSRSHVEVGDGTGAGGTEGDGGVKMGADARGGGAVRRKRSSRGMNPRGRRKTCSRQFFEISATFQPPLLDTLDLKAGVCIEEGGGTKQGPPPEEDAQHMSREEFKSRTSPLARGSVGLFPSPIDTISSGDRITGEKRDTFGGKGSQEQRSIFLAPAMHPLASLTKSPNRGDTTTTPIAGDMTPRTVARVNAKDGVKTLDPLVGGTTLEPCRHRDHHGTGARVLGGKAGRMVVGIDGSPEAFSVGEQPEDDPHWRLHKDGAKEDKGIGSDVGEGGSEEVRRGGFRPAPPPPFPRKPGTREKRRTHSNPGLRGPRDRGRFIIPTGARKHLPPPPLGETMGHGLSPPRDRGQPLQRGSPASLDETSATDDGPLSATGGVGQSGNDVGSRMLRRKPGHFPPLPSATSQSLSPVRVDRGFKGRKRRGSSDGWISTRRSHETIRAILRF